MKLEKYTNETRDNKYQFKIKENKIMKKICLTLSIMVVGVLAVAQTVSAAVIQENVFVDDYDDGNIPSDWHYQAVGDSDINSTDDYEDMVYESADNRWEAPGSNGKFVKLTDSLDIDTDPYADNDTVVLRWEAALSGIAEVVIDGYTRKNYGDSEDEEVGILDNDGAEIWSETYSKATSFEHTESDISVSQGDYIYVYGRSTQGGNAKQLWDLDDGPNGDGVKITVVPEPSSLVMVSVFGVLLLWRRKRI
ncbi:MAG: PEP-CTERM sorting domain-containing protein [Verrucomicrobiota bacterium]